MTLNIITNSPRGNLAVNRATCSHFINESKKGVHWPCVKCNAKKIVRDVCFYQPLVVCPCGVFYPTTDYFDNNSLHVNFTKEKL